MLSPAKQYFIALMSAFLNEQPPPAPPQLDWEELYTVARKQNLSGIVWHMVNQLESSQQPPENVAQRLQQEYIGTVHRSATLDYEIGLVWQALNEQKVAHIPLKGVEIKAYWPIPDLRTMGDIDYVIRAEDAEKSKEALTDLGYAFQDMGYVWDYTKGNVLLEEHHKVEYYDRVTDSKQFLYDYWDNALPLTKYTYSLTPEYHAMFLLAHLVKHLICSGCGMRQVMDIAAYFQHFRNILDWDKLWKRLDDMRLTAFTETILSYCQFILQVDVCDNSRLAHTPDVFEKISETLLAKGVFGEGVLMFKGAFHANHKRGSRLSKLWRDIGSVWAVFFPSYATLCESSKYAYVRGRPWLLWFAYFHRGVRSILGKDRLFKKVLNMSALSYKAVEKQQEMYENMRLDD